MVAHGEVRGAVIRDLQNFKNAAYGLIFTVMIASVATNWATLKPRFVLPASGAGAISYLSDLMLVAAVVVLILRWVAASTSELNLWITYVTVDSPRSTMFMSMFVLSLVLGLLVFMSLQTFGIFVAYMLIYFTINIVTQNIFNRQYRRARRRTPVESPGHELALGALDHYWTARPQLLRLLVMLLFTALSSVLWFAAPWYPPAWQDRLRVAARLLFITSLVLGEIVISAWRQQRDDDIEEAANAIAV